MNENSVSTKLTQKFDNTSPDDAIVPCCKDVAGEWEEIPKFVPTDVKYVSPGGIYTTYYLGVIPKGFKLTIVVNLSGRIRGTLVCTCKDNNQKLSRTKVDLPFATDVEVPVYRVNIIKRLLGGPIAAALTIADVIRLAKQAYDIYSGSPEFFNEVAKYAAHLTDKAVAKIKNSANEICKNLHKCKTQNLLS